MNINILSASRSLSRSVAILVIVLIQLPAVSPAFDLGTSIRSDSNIFSLASQSNLLIPTAVFSNTTSFTVTDRVSTVSPPGVASLYPSPIVVSGQSGTISDVNVTISGLTAARPRDLDLLLVAPGGQTLVVMADAGDLCAVNNIDVTIDDSAASVMPDPTGGCPPGTPLSTGSWRPTNYVFGTEVDTFPAPAPAGPYNHPAPAGAATLATAFNGIAPNGTWNLYVADDSLGGGVSTIAGGWSLNITTVGGIDPTSTGIVSSVNPAATGQSITFTSTTTNSTTATAVTTGTVTFTNNGVNIAGCVGLLVNASGQVACTTTLAEGTRLIVANYSGTAVLGASNGSLTQVVNSPTIVTGAQFCNNGGLTITDAGTSSPVYPSTITVAGLTGTISKVTTQINGFTAPRPSNIDFLLVGSNNAGFTFMSDIGDSVTAATSLNFTFDDTAATQPPQAPLSSGTFRPTDYDPGADPDTFPAPAPGGAAQPAPAGAATFASVYNTSNPNGSWRLYAIDDGIGGGNSAITGWCVNFTLTPFATTTGVTSSADPSVFGQAVTFTATVSTAGNGTPTGNVQFFDGATPIGGAIVLNGSGQAALTTSALTVGNHTITAQYAGATVGAGGGGFAASTGSLTTNPQTVNQASTTTTIIPSSNPVGIGVPVTFTVTVNPVAPGAGTRTGTVTISRNGDPVCPNLTINGSGQASCNITFTIAGNYNITAQYSGDANFLGSTSLTLVEQASGPTAAGTNVSGRVLDTDGRGISGARISMQNQNGDFVWAITNPFGYYRFFNVPAGQNYFVNVVHKRYSFEPRTINLADEVTGLDFVAVAGSRPNGQKEQESNNRRSP